MTINVNQIRSEFPALSQSHQGKPQIYLDSAATSLKPRSVIDRLSHFYSYETANVHRGAHFLSDRATEFYEQARQKVARFINASSPSEVVFVRGTTEGINLVAHCLGQGLQEGDEVLVSEIEHHSNIVPWQLLEREKKIKLKVLEATSEGFIEEETLKSSFTKKTKILAITHASNHLGNVLDLDMIIRTAHNAGVLVVVDGAQAVGKIKVDVQKLNADFYVFSGHKMFAPFGIGAVYGKKHLFDSLPPYQGGGSMIAKVSFQGTTFNDIPFRFEAGTPNVGGAVALGTAIDFIDEIGESAIEAYESELCLFALTELSRISGIQILGPTKDIKHKIPVFSFNLEGLHGSDVGFLLNQQGIAVRAGHHCTQPLVEKLKITGSIRASFSIYNSLEDISSLVKGLVKAKDLLQ